MIETFNPFFVIFASYGLGVLVTELVKFLGGYAYFEERHYISDKLTKALGVLHFGWLIRHSFMGMFNPRIRFKGKFDRAKLEGLKSEMTAAEIHHLMGFFVLFIYILVLGFLGIAWWQLIAYTLCNIVFNLYLVFLQQYNKRRIDRILRLKKNSLNG